MTRFLSSLSLVCGLLFVAGCGEDASGRQETFPPEDQTPFIEKGEILPPDSLACVPVDTGIPQMNCNHHGSTVAELAGGAEEPHLEQGRIPSGFTRGDRSCVSSPSQIHLAFDFSQNFSLSM